MRAKDAGFIGRFTSGRAGSFVTIHGVEMSNFFENSGR
jgi:hypothetical protein